MSKLILCTTEYLQDLSLNNKLYDVLKNLSTEEDFKFELYAIENADDQGS